MWDEDVFVVMIRKRLPWLSMTYVEPLAEEIVEYIENQIEQNKKDENKK